MPGNWYKADPDNVEMATKVLIMSKTKSINHINQLYMQKIVMRLLTPFPLEVKEICKYTEIQYTDEGRETQGKP